MRTLIDELYYTLVRLDATFDPPPIREARVRRFWLLPPEYPVGTLFGIPVIADPSVPPGVLRVEHQRTGLIEEIPIRELTDAEEETLRRMLLPRSRS